MPGAITDSPPAEAIASAQDNLIDTVTASQQEALQALEAGGHAMFDGLSRVQREVADFVAARIRQDLETQQAMLRCRTMDDVRDVQARFLKTAMDQYSAEAQRLMRLGGEVVTKTLERSPA